MLSGRPYAFGALADRAAAVVQAFLPGEEGGCRGRRGPLRPGRAVRPAPGERPARTGRRTGHVSARTARRARVAATVRNTGERPGTEVVQLYLSDPVASVVRPAGPLARGLGPGPAGARRRRPGGVREHADRTSFTGPDFRRIVEPGTVGVAVGPSSAELPLRGSFVLEGPERTPGPDRVLTVPAETVPLP